MEGIFQDGGKVKITRRQLRRLIAEAFATTPAGDAALRVGQRSSVMDPDRVEHLSNIGKEDPYQAYELADMLGSEEQPPIENLEVDLPIEALLVSGKPEVLETLGFENILRSIELDKKLKPNIAFRLAPEKLERAKYKANVLNKPVKDLMEIAYSWWAGDYMAIEEWIENNKNNPDLYTSTILESPYRNEEHTLYDIKGVKMLHISSAENPSTYTI